MFHQENFFEEVEMVVLDELLEIVLVANLTKRMVYNIFPRIWYSKTLKPVDGNLEYISKALCPSAERLSISSSSSSSISSSSSHRPKS